MSKVFLLCLVMLCGIAAAQPAATDSRIALANLDALIEQGAGDAAGIDLLLLRAQFLADDHALDRAVALTAAASTPLELLRRSRARAAVHRFADALADLDAAERAGARVDAQRASLWVAMGRADEALAPLQAEAARRPGFAAHVALARGMGAVGRLAEADALYERALAELYTTSPFPAAAIWFARGVMWAEQGGDAPRGRRMYEEALRLLPEFVVANVHLAELEASAGESVAAIARLRRVVEASDEPEARALLGTLRESRDDVDAARRRFSELLARHPLAYADHAAEFFLGAGDDVVQARHWAGINLAGRATRRAYLLAIRAAEAADRFDEAMALHARMQARFPNPAAS